MSVLIAFFSIYKQYNGKKVEKYVIKHLFVVCLAFFIVLQQLTLLYYRTLVYPTPLPCKQGRETAHN